jgi:high-affinity iron transporter
VGESLLITLREGFEAALIVAIVLAYLRKIERLDLAKSVWVGTAAAVALSIVIGVVLQVTLDGLDGAARYRTFAGICVAAAAVLVWMVFWMRRQARGLKGELEGKVDHAVMTSSTTALAAVAFFAVIREGIETALFLIAATTGSATDDVLIGGVIGIALAIVLGIAVYQGGRTIPMRTFFQVTGVLIIIFAAGLLAKAVMFLQPQFSGDLGSFAMSAFDVTSVRWLTGESQVGRFLAGIFGWDPRPSIEQVLIWLAAVIPLTIAFFADRAPRVSAPAVQPDPPPAPEARPTASATAER